MIHFFSKFVRATVRYGGVPSSSACAVDPVQQGGTSQAVERQAEETCQPTTAR